MRTLAGAATTAINSGSVAIVQLVHMAFSGGVVALNSSNWDLVWGGVTYKGAYGLGSVSPVVDKPGEVQGIQLELAGGSSTNIGLALDAADQVQGTVLTLRTAIVETANYTVVDAPVDWAGTLDTMAISEDGATATIRVTAESRAVDLLKGTPQYYTDADQQAIAPGDRAFAYVLDQIGKPVTWPAKSYFYQ
jgi:hypothetical protein